uniref:Cell cycle checkpoint control protein RAD9A n=1 Tax=Nothobranchius furzeri TaxID=105023 RepID=A0A8C6KNU0_NOTFU
MQCVVTGGNVKVLAKAIHSLSRIGDELYVEPCFSLCVNQSVQTVFRSVATLEKTVEKCHIELDEAKDRLTFTLHCKHGLLKTHNLSYQDSESLQAVFDKDSYANVFRAHPRLLVDTVVHFPLSVEEVTVTVSDERMWVRNHVEDEAERSRAMLTELCLASDEFDHFAVKAHHSITFCLKELRGLLAFAESTGLLLSMYLDEPGSPVVLSVTDSVLEGNFVLATLSDDHNLCKNNNKGPDAEQPPPPDDFMNDDIDSYLIAMDTSVAPGPSAANPPTTSLAAARETPSDRHRIRRHSEEEEDGDRLPNKKFRSIFFGSVLPPSPQTSMQPVPTQEVLASNSEDETEAD